MNVKDFLRQESKKIGLSDAEIDEQIAAMEKQLGPVTGELTQAQQEKLRRVMTACLFIRMFNPKGREILEDMQKQIEQKFEQRARTN